MAFGFGSQTPSAQSSGFGFGASSSPASSFGFGGFGASSAAAPTPLFGAATGGFGAASSSGMFGANSGSNMFGAASTPAFGFGQQQSQPSLFGASQQQQQQPQQQQQNQLAIFGASSQQQQQQPSFSGFGQSWPQQQQQQQQQQPGPLTAYAAAQMAPASQEVVAIAQAFSKDSDQYPFRHLFLNVVDDPRRYGRPRGVTDLEWREAVQRAGGPNNADKLWPVLLRGFDELVARKNAQTASRLAAPLKDASTLQDSILKEHRQRLQNAVEMAAKLQRNEETLLKGKMDQIKLRYADLSSQLLRVVHAVDGLEGRFAEASHYHNSRAHQAHSAVAQDLAQVEAGLGHNSGAGLKSRAEALAAASVVQADGPVNGHRQPLNQNDLDSVQQLLTQNQKVLTKLQGVLRKDNRDVAIMSQTNDELSLMVT